MRQCEGNGKPSRKQLEGDLTLVRLSVEFEKFRDQALKLLCELLQGLSFGNKTGYVVRSRDPNLCLFVPFGSNEVDFFHDEQFTPWVETKEAPVHKGKGVPLGW